MCLAIACVDWMCVGLLWGCTRLMTGGEVWMAFGGVSRFLFETNVNQQCVNGVRTVSIRHDSHCPTLDATMDFYLMCALSRSAPSAQLKIVTDLRDSVDVVHVALPEVLSGLVHVLETSQPQNEQNEEHKLRKSSIEVLHRVPHTTALKDHVPRLAACLQSVALQDNQENAIVAMKVVLDLMRAFKPELEEAAIPMLEVFVKVSEEEKDIL